MEDDRFQQILQCSIKARTITKYRSRVTGLTVTHIDAEGPIVKGYFTLATEETGHDGLPHTLEHLIFLGSQLYPYKGVLDLAANHCLAQGTNAWTAIDHTAYTVETAGSKGFLILLPIYLDHIFFPTLADQAFKTEVHHINGAGDDAGVVYCEMQARENNAESREEHAVQDAVFANACGYKCETGGLMANLRDSCSNKKVRDYHKRFYRPENLDVIISGQINVQEIFDAIRSVDERVAKVDYSSYSKPWTADVELFSSYKTSEVLFPAKEKDNGRVSLSWKGPPLMDSRACLAHDTLWDYLSETSASPLVKALIDIPEPCCSSISFYSDEYPTTIFHVKFKGVKPDMHARIKTIVMETLQETLQSSMDMERLRNQVKNVICNSADKLENDPSEGLASAVILDHLYGGEDHSYLKTYTGLFEDLKSLREKDEDFWKDILKYYLEEPYVTVNSVPSLECMMELEATEKKRVEEQQAKLGKSGLEECEKEVADCIEFNEKNFDEVEAIIEALPEVNYADQMSFHTIHTHPEQTPGIFLHEIDSEFCRFFFTFDTAHLSGENKTMLGLYATLFCDTPLHHNDKEISHEEAIKLKEQLLLRAKCSVSGSGGETFSEVVTMEFKFLMEDFPDCKSFISSLISNKIFSSDRVSTAVNKMLSKIGVALRKAKNILGQIDIATRLHGSCKSSRTLYTEQSLLNSGKEDIPGLIAKLQELQQVLVYGNNVSLHIITSKSNTRKFFSSEELSKLSSLYHLSKANHPSRLPSFYGRKNAGVQRVMKIVPTDESSYLILTFPIQVSFDHPDYIAVALFAEYVGQLEGVLWKQIRGQGFAYSYSLFNSPASGSLAFYLGRATNVSKAYLVAKETIEGILKEGQLDDTQIETAKGALAYNFIDKFATPCSSANTNITNLHRGLPLNNDSLVLTKISGITEAVLLEACKKYFQPLFTDAANVIVCCPENKKDEISGDMSSIGLNLNIVEDVEEYIGMLDEREKDS